MTYKKPPRSAHSCGRDNLFAILSILLNTIHLASIHYHKRYIWCLAIGLVKITIDNLPTALCYTVIMKKLLSIRRISGALGTILSIAANLFFVKYIAEATYNPNSIADGIAMWILCGALFFWALYLVLSFITRK